jgi:hypothetical protein
VEATITLKIVLSRLKVTSFFLILSKSSTVRNVDELEDEAALTQAELESGDWVFDVAVEAWAPLNVKANDEAVETAAVDAVNVVKPEVNHLGCVGDEGLDLVGVECYFEEVVGVFVHFVVTNCGGGCNGEMKKSGNAEFECGKWKCRVVYIRRKR